MDLMLWAVHIFATVERADWLDSHFIFQLLVLPFEHKIKEHHREVNNDTDRNSDDNVLSGSGLWIIGILLHALKDNKSCHVEL